MNSRFFDKKVLFQQDNDQIAIGFGNKKFPVCSFGFGPDDGSCLTGAVSFYVQGFYHNREYHYLGDPTPPSKLSYFNGRNG